MSATVINRSSSSFISPNTWEVELKRISALEQRVNALTQCVNELTELKAQLEFYIEIQKLKAREAEKAAGRRRYAHCVR